MHWVEAHTAYMNQGWYLTLVLSLTYNIFLLYIIEKLRTLMYKFDAITLQTTVNFMVLIQAMKD